MLGLAKAAVAASLVQGTASAAVSPFIIEATNAYGPLTEVGDTTVTITLDHDVPPPGGGGRFRCGATTVFVQGTVVQMSAILDPPSPTAIPPQPCEFAASADVGPLAPGDYTVTADIALPDRTTAAADSAFTIVARGIKCNVDPAFNTILVTLANKSVSDFRFALESDPAYRAMLGNIAYVGVVIIDVFSGKLYVEIAPLGDPVRVLDRLERSGEFSELRRSSRPCLGAPDVVRSAIEYYNTALDHYFFTADSNEQQAIDAGLVGAGWIRTGKSFPVLVFHNCPAQEDGLHPVYRFTGEPNVGPNSHFFTASQDECGYVRDRIDWHWMFEGAPFWATEPVAGSCSAGQQRLYRAFNNGKGGTPNHRYAVDHAIIDTMVAQGWVDEGPAMCVLAGP